MSNSKTMRTATRTVEAPAVPAVSKKAGSKALVHRDLTALAPDVLQQITSMAAQGWTEAAIWRSLGLPRDEWRQRKKEDPGVAAALSEGRSLDLHQCMHVLRASAIAIDKKTNLPVLNSKEPKALTALLAYLKLVHGLRDHGNVPPPADTGGSRHVHFHLPKPMTMDELRAAAAPALPAPVDAEVDDHAE